MDITRRTLLAGAAALPAAAEALAQGEAMPPPAELARDDGWWSRVAALYDAPPDETIQLEAGQFGAMATNVRRVYERRLARINRETTIYTRGPLAADLAAVRESAAALLGVGVDEIAFTRGGSESMAALIGGYNRLKPGDAVLYADLDYDAMQTGMESLARLRGVKAVKIDLPEPATRQNIIDAYERALRDHPAVRMMLLTHLSHRTGLVPPVKEIIALARARNVDVLLDVGHALGQLEFSLRDLGVDFAGINLHKWIASPLGVGLVYIRKDRIPDIDPCLLEGASDRIDARVHTGTVNYAALLTVPDAITVHQSIGLANKAARLRHLRDRWAEVLRDDKRFEILTPDDPSMHGGITSFRIRGRTSPADNIALRKALFEKHGIFTVERLGPAKGACVRVSPSFINDSAQIDRLVKALRELATVTV
ncbi:aminotransferase class V-fold PLP-dependent enzyme [Rhizorhabdus dicambivorans]|uniref:Aminotransferase class V-fold PLP-dependent enzyme n=1 Tax=Rhizorhabdus dicambivorans TaxID=1850238 RepID=A0A2A4G1Q2_9SPHN|nr:aminotransferase class V-fold PLP-dependent enzyme [Rhizorhabdus dicambivorans]ATE66582.1 aminotransferase class V-fold PLP-dependent enzyme [Rhizorhabdus dicambivorans]PCE43935.1 aminotransferase class V-fold PLP-dependent enzyme [Rhizorhabdus dicambivorans]